MDRRQGQWVFYRINPSLPDWAKSVLKLATDKNTPFLKENLRHLRDMGDRPERIRPCCQEFTPHA